jgi:Cysteine-rich secretory protein family
MLERDFYAHESPEGETVRDRFMAEGGSRWKLVLENIGMCENCPTALTEDRVQSFHEGWMESPEHRANILAAGLEGFGFGIADGNDRTYAVQTFAGPGTPEGPEPNEDAAEVSPPERARLALEAVNHARRDTDLPALEPREALDTLAGRVIDAIDPNADEAAADPDSPHCCPWTRRRIGARWQPSPRSAEAVVRRPPPPMSTTSSSTGSTRPLCAERSSTRKCATSGSPSAPTARGASPPSASWGDREGRRTAISRPGGQARKT